jgi:hypothetical protein
VIEREPHNQLREDLGQIYDEADEEGKEKMHSLAEHLLRAQATMERNKDAEKPDGKLIRRD